ncbi:hypothetical protein [Vibrio owensii]|uniref:hypothetical protein n=1 Tax=Vibrio harveyi group TaxID=717610 RepID=UPI003CC6CB8F
MNTKTPVQYLKQYLKQIAEALPDYRELNLNKKEGGKSVYGSYFEFTKAVEADFLRLFHVPNSGFQSIGLSFYYLKEIEPYIRVSTSKQADKSDLTYSIPIPVEAFKTMLKKMLNDNPGKKNEDMVRLISDTFINGEVEGEMKIMMQEKLKETEGFRAEITDTFDSICRDSLALGEKYQGSASEMTKAKRKVVSDKLAKTDEYQEVQRLKSLLAQAEAKQSLKQKKIEKEVGFDVYLSQVKSDTNDARDMVENCLSVMLESTKGLTADKRHIANKLMIKKLTELNVVVKQMTGYTVRDDDYTVAIMLRDNGITGYTIQPEK